jgi:hypothetical protein
VQGGVLKTKDPKPVSSSKPKTPWIDKGSPAYPKPWQSVSQWFEEYGAKDQYFRNGGYIDWINSDSRFQAARKDVLDSPVFGVPQDIIIRAAGDDGWQKGLQMAQDGLVYSSWLMSPTDATAWDYQAQVGSYQGQMELTRISENRIRIDYRLFNVISYESASPNRDFGAFLDGMSQQVTQNFIWTEYVDG